MSTVHSSLAASFPHNDKNLVPSLLDFPVVGLGASAGGLKALQAFFEHLPLDTDMAFVVVMHLSPKHESHADAIFQRVTKLPVTEVMKATRIEKNHVYVISPKLQLEMNDGYLHVKEAVRPVDRHVVIDLFFKTLADTHRARAFGIILSGTGADGAVGLARLKEQGGLTLAQSPKDAEYDAMPIAAIETGMVDLVLPVVEMPQKLVDLWRNARAIVLPKSLEKEESITVSPGISTSEEDEGVLRDILNMLRLKTGHDFRDYKRATVLRRIERRLQVREVADLPSYREVFKADPAEGEALLNDMLIGVTQFFRDRESFDTVERDVIPAIFEGKTESDQVRVWSAACSTGEEAYSLAILLKEHAATLTSPPSLQVFGTDIDERAISIARTGSYPAAIDTDVSPGRLREYFTKEQSRYKVRKPVRDTILFAAQNLLRDPPFSKLDFISCRNLLIYLNRERHAQILEMFHFVLNPNGFLFLGSSESAESLADYFVPVDKKSRLYCARRVARSTWTAISFPGIRYAPNAVSAPAKPPDPPRFSFGEVHQRGLADYSPPSVLVNAHFEIMHMSEGTSDFLRYIAGEPSRNLVSLVEPELRLELRTALFHALQSGKSVETQRIKVERPGQIFFVNMTARPFVDTVAGSQFVLVLFHRIEQTTSEPVAGPRGEKQDAILAGLEADLQRTKLQLQDTIEHSETSSENLKASNEELQAINEELRSATEELETSREELQSVNEELITVNNELRRKVDETGKSNDDLQNLIVSTDIATIFVDRGMRIKRFTPRAAAIFNILPGDVGLSLHDITHKLDYQELATDAEMTFQTLRSVEREVIGEGGHAYIARLLPYRSGHDRIEGAILTFIDITRRHLAEIRFRESEARMRLVAESTKDYAIITFDVDGFITSFNKGAERIFGYTEEEVLGLDGEIIYTLEDRNTGAFDNEKKRAREAGRAEDERWHLCKDASRFYCSGVMSPLSNGEFHGYAKIGRDLTGRIEEEWARAQQLTAEQSQRAEAQAASALKDEFLAIMSHELKHPLNLIHMNAELLLRLPETKKEPVISKAVSTIHASAVSQSKIIDDLLDLSRANTGKLTLSLANIDLRLLVKSAIEAVRTNPDTQRLSLTSNEYPEPLMIYADSVRVEQVIWNLLSNAIKFTPPDGKIDVEVSIDTGHAKIEVRDNGQGIDPVFLPRVFDMFGQETASIMRGTAGLGIGLSLVRQIVELHGGRVSGTSDGLGHGACFTALFPIRSVPDIKIVEEKPDQNIALLGMRVLLIDDMQDSVDIFKMLLEIHGAIVTASVTARDALDLFRDHSYDIVMSDIGMPDMDGYSFVKELRRQPKGANIVTVAVTGLGREKDIERALEAGFTSHISKPVVIEEVLKLIEELDVRH